MKKQIKCPRCKKETEYSPENPSRPFCSERCRQIDFGEWADEKHAIPTEDHQAPSDEKPDPESLH